MATRHCQPTTTTTPKEAVNLDVAMVRLLEDLSKRLLSMEADSKSLHNNRHGGPRPIPKDKDRKPKCPHCRMHKNRNGDEKCWELKANADSCPKNLVSRKK